MTQSEEWKMKCTCGTEMEWKKFGRLPHDWKFMDEWEKQRLKRMFSAPTWEDWWCPTCKLTPTKVSEEQKGDN